MKEGRGGGGRKRGPISREGEGENKLSRRLWIINLFFVFFVRLANKAATFFLSSAVDHYPRQETIVDKLLLRWGVAGDRPPFVLFFFHLPLSAADGFFLKLNSHLAHAFPTHLPPPSPILSRTRAFARTSRTCTRPPLR